MPEKLNSQQALHISLDTLHWLNPNSTTKIAIRITKCPSSNAALLQQTNSSLQKCPQHHNITYGLYHNKKKNMIPAT